MTLALFCVQDAMDVFATRAKGLWGELDAAGRPLKLEPLFNMQYQAPNFFEKLLDARVLKDVVVQVVRNLLFFFDKGHVSRIVKKPMPFQIDQQAERVLGAVLSRRLRVRFRPAGDTAFAQ